VAAASFSEAEVAVVAMVAAVALEEAAITAVATETAVVAVTAVTTLGVAMPRAEDADVEVEVANPPARSAVSMGMMPCDATPGSTMPFNRNRRTAPPTTPTMAKTPPSLSGTWILERPIT
jgi:hypothetical protein